MPFTENTSIGELLANEEAKKVLEKHAPGSTTHPMVSMAKPYSLKQLMKIPQANLSKEKVDLIVADLAKISK